MGSNDEKINKLKFVVAIPAADRVSGLALMTLKYQFDNRIMVIDKAQCRNQQGEQSKFQLVTTVMKNLNNFIQARFDQEETEFVRYTEPEFPRNRGQKRRGNGGYRGAKRGRGNFNNYGRY